MNPIEQLLEPATRTLSTLRAVSNLLPHVPKFLPGAKVSPATLLRDWAERTPTALALAFESQRFTWKDVNDRANRWALWLSKEGIRAGDVVAIDMDNRPEFLFALHGLAKLGAVGALINTNLTGTPLAHAIRISGARKVLAGSEHLASVREAVAEIDELSASDDLWVQHPAEAGSAPADARVVDGEVASGSSAERGDDHTPRIEDTFVYIYTSGTTGLPKAAIISGKRYMTAGIGFGALMVRSRPGDVIYVPLPLYHSSALILGWGSTLGSGAAMALRRKFSASKFIEDVREHGATSFLYIGELCRYLLNTPEMEGERDHKLRVAVGNGMRPDIWEAFQERFGIPLVREFYGATEGNTALINLEGRPGMIGRKMPGQAIVRCDAETGEPKRNAEGFCEEIATGDTGLLLGRVSRVLTFDGYVDREASDKKLLRDVFKAGDAYFNTGDLVQLHGGGWVSFADRVGDTFRWKGENVSTNEVADVLDGAPGVLEANVYGVAVPGADGRAGMAALSVSGDFALDAFAEHVVSKLPSYQRPLFLRMLGDEMEVTGTFKHRKVDYRKEGFDPAVVSDEVFWLRGDHYERLDAEAFAAIERGEQKVG